MAQIFPFQPYRYSYKAGAAANLVTQPYDKISPAMQARYLAASPYNLVRIILGEKSAADSDKDNAYTRAAAHLNSWIASGILEKDNSPSLYAYFQRFQVPDTGETLERKGFIGLGAVEDYSAGVVHRHEQTLSGPKKDRLELLRHTHAHFGQIFMLYPDRELAVDKLLDGAAGAGAPVTEVTDEYGALHRMWRIADPAVIACIQQFMADKKLLIADGHHRYETALALRNESPGWKAAEKVMMTFVNMHSPGLEILATHRVANRLNGFDGAALAANVRARKLGSVEELKQMFRAPQPAKIRIGIALGSGEVYVCERERKPGELDVKVLHEEILGRVLGITEEAVRDEKNIEYVRGLDAAYGKVREGGAQVAFLLEPTTIEQVADVAFSGGVMPQKSTDFYPKLLSGMTIYKLDN
ncbi:MAG TPA: DUF1015 domain-containing protein [Bryobacteraceae bacterium]|nr:DUF1015 domain-containing protein [Bryobacteraceae bacterium]